jgi:hypothetical protein
MLKKKGKKSLEASNSLIKKSSILKELKQSFTPSSLGININNISTTSITYLPPLPPSYSIKDNSIIFCEKVGFYFVGTGAKPNVVGSTGSKYFRSKLTFINLDGSQNSQKGTGWKVCISHSYNWSTQVPGSTGGGYLFIYFYEEFERESIGVPQGFEKYVGGICSKIYKNDDRVMDTNQGEIFAVVINNISEINALNRTFASQSGGNFLSNAINDALNNNNTDVKKIITNIRTDYSSGNPKIENPDTTPIMSYAANPLILVSNTVKIYLTKGVVFNVRDIIPYARAFRVNSTRYLTESEVDKISFDDFSLLNVDFLAILGYKAYEDPIIEFFNLGTVILNFRNKYFEDTENICQNPNGPRFYGPKKFSLRINVLPSPDS